MKLPFLKQTVASVLSATVFTASAFAYTYVVKEGDVLSEIADRTIAGKIYGKEGGIEILKDLNPQIENPDLIYPGDKINLYDEDAALSESRPAPEGPRAPAGDVPVAEPTATQIAPTVSQTEAPLCEAPKNSRLEIAPVFRRGASLALTPHFSFLSLESQDVATQAHSTVASKYDVGLTVGYIQNWSETFRSNLYLKVGTIEFEKPTNSKRTLVDGSHLMTDLGFGMSQDFNEKLNLQLHFNYGKELFVRAATTQSDTVDTINLPSIGTLISYDLVHLDPFTLGVSGVFNLKFPGLSEEFSVKSGNEYGASIYLKQFASSLDDSKFRTELSFIQRRQDTSIARQSETSISLTLNYFFSVGRRQGEGK